MKTICLLLAACLLNLIVLAQPVGNELRLEKGGVIPFSWKGDSLAGRWEPCAAMLLPVFLPGQADTLWMQFDLGAPQSVLYQSQLFPDTATVLSLQLGALPVHLTVKKMMDHAATGHIIGTIGADLVKDRVLAIDYPHRLITLSDSMRNTDTTHGFPFHFVQGRILLPAIVHGHSTLLFFDTGSSAFSLLTSQDTWQQLAIAGARPAIYPVRSWKDTWQAHTIASADSITLAGNTIALNTVTYMEGPGEATIARMQQMGIGGLMGNQLLLDKVLVLDMRRQMFKVVR